MRSISVPLTLSIIALVAILDSQVAHGAGGFPGLIPTLLYGPGMRNPSSCVFNGPTDSSALRGQNFIENFGTGSCLTLKKTGQNNLPVQMDTCSWNSLPISPQLYFIQNGNGGSIIKPTVSGVFGGDTCLTTTSFGDQLSGTRCANSGKDFSQTWRFSKIRTNLYQIMQVSGGKCLRVDSTRVGAVPTTVRCNAFDNFQLWRICTSK